LNIDIDDYTEKIKKMQKTIEEKKTQQIELEAKKKHLVEQREEISKEFEALKVDPKNIDSEIEKIQNELIDGIKEVETILAENSDE
jgi:hypothetical protein